MVDKKNNSNLLGNNMQQLPLLNKQMSQKVKINVDDILEKFDCPICMCRLTDPFISKCGHTFCKVKLIINIKLRAFLIKMLITH